MITIVLEAIAYGLFLSFLIGPILMTLVDVSVQYGLKMGLTLASGIWASDMLIVAIMLSVADTAQPTLSELTVRTLTTIAAIIFITIGARYIIKSNQILISDPLPPPSLQKLFFRGLAVNTINPFTFVFWTTLTTGKVIIRKAGVTEQLVFFGTLLVMIMLTDAVKVVLSDRLGKILHSGHLRYLHLLTAIVFVASGLYILYRFYR